MAFADDPVTIARTALERGDQQYQLGRVEAACRQYEMAVVVAPEWWYPAYKKALCDMSRGRYRDAYYLLSRARASRDNLYVIHLAMGRWYRHEEQAAKAISSYEAAIQAARGAVVPMIELADVLISEKRTGEARLFLKRAQFLSPTNLAVRGRLAKISEELGHLADAEELFRYLALYGTDRRKNIARLARFYQRHGNSARAQAALALLVLEKRSDWKLPEPVGAFPEEASN
jgi:tetratricopeptide (TPR) repeat protein